MTIESIKQRCDVDPVSGCWIWRGGKTQDGYGKLTINRRTTRASRLSFETAAGVTLPRGVLVCHSCDNPPCVNPAHLFTGTVADNNRDAVIKGRHRHGLHTGACHAARRIPAEKFAALRRLLGDGLSAREIGRRLGISKSTVRRIATGASPQPGRW